MLEQEEELGWDDEPLSPMSSGSPVTPAAAAAGAAGFTGKGSAREQAAVEGPAQAGKAARVPGRVIMGEGTSSSSSGKPLIGVAEPGQKEVGSAGTPKAAAAGRPPAAPAVAASPPRPIPLSSSAVIPQSPDERQVGLLQQQGEVEQLQQLKLDDDDVLQEVAPRGPAAAQVEKQKEDMAMESSTSSVTALQQQQEGQEGREEEDVVPALSGPASSAPAAGSGGGGGGVVSFVGSHPASSDEGSSSYQAEVMSAPSDGSSGQRDWCMVSSPRMVAEAHPKHRQEQGPQQQQQEAAGRDAGSAEPAAGPEAAAAAAGADEQPSISGGELQGVVEKVGFVVAVA